ncbi:uncharacterized protein HKW66_Vig0089900 [Vigna angularis]|uniref:Uncharacterized protein n=1 Tax=Phaseolus angularis TaxID=3914 RepID=A0A8T0KH97_PHAAN|nr:uncharacterized protein HKW66_Vig0089900 [Vigna angularis]
MSSKNMIQSAICHTTRPAPRTNNTNSSEEDDAGKLLLEYEDPSNRKGASKGEGKTNGPSTGELQKPDPETKEPKGSRFKARK